MKPSKVIVAGLKGVGKTTLLEQLIYGRVETQDIHPTIEDIYVASVETERGTREVLRFYDTEGIGYPPEVTSESILFKQYHSLADAFVLIYATNSPASVEVVDLLKRDIDRNRDKKEVPIIVLGITSKGDPASLPTRQVDPSFVSSWATREKVRHFEVALKSRKTLVPPFTYLASKLNPPPTKSSFPQFPQLGGGKKVKE